MADLARLAEVPLSLCCPNLSFRSCRPNLFSSKSTFTRSYTSAHEAGQTSKPVARSSRGKTRKSLGLGEVQLGSPSSSRSELSRDKEINTNTSTTAQNNDHREVHMFENDLLENPGATSFAEWTNKNRETTGPTKVPITNSKEFSERIQDLINADLERRYSSDKADGHDNDDYPLFVDEDDPYWLDEPDEGWGYRVSELFKENLEIKKVRQEGNADSDDDVHDMPEIQWDLEPEKWSAKDVDSMSWTSTVFGDPSPLVVMLYDRYGKTGRECYHVLRELEEAANRIWETNRLPPRLARINVSFEVDLTSALRVKEVPTLLFIKGGKLLHQQSGYHTADDLLRIISYFYYGAAKPSCLKKVQVAENVATIQ